MEIITRKEKSTTKRLNIKTELWTKESWGTPGKMLDNRTEYNTRQ